uniref:Putative DegT/DnrJ/EryC1/StrS family aminotransferase n=1 Tax=Magnetococcus massalia (strain MO-1) TaxID=451514 RepID=A0A1S7LGA8_MAGMO|nr:putative DegT/DnrJ/EryC1/StrS family aminotransferase [Candidatus Magnetococcus massalia]
MIPIAKPLMGEQESALVAETIASGWVTQGPRVATFEENFAQQVGVAEAVAVSSCTAGLHLALHAMGAGPGDEVITVSSSFIATANAIGYCGATPVFVDIEADTLNMDVALLEGAISAKTVGILAVHQLGMPCDLTAIKSIAEKHGLWLVEDAACAIGSEIEIDGAWRNIGHPVGAMAVFSFHPRKVLTTGDGGMITTNDTELANRLRKLRQHGMDISDRERHSAGRVIFESYPEPGFNYRMTDIQAAVGIVQLTRLQGIIAGRREIAERYHALFAKLPGVTPPHQPPWARSNWQSYALRLPAGTEQKSVMNALLEQQVSSRRGVMCAHLEGAWPKERWRAGSSLSESQKGRDETIMLPIYPQMSPSEVEQVVDGVRAVVR